MSLLSFWGRCLGKMSPTIVDSRHAPEIESSSSQQSTQEETASSQPNGKPPQTNVNLPAEDDAEEDLTIIEAIWENFMGHSSERFKIFVVSSLALNPIITVAFGKTIGAWLVLLEFLVTLAMALEAYPLQAGGLLVIEANIIGLTSPHTLLDEVTTNLNVIIMIVFMVASIHFLKNLLLWIFTKILLKVQDKIQLSVLMLLAATFMSAFLDALTVSAVVVSVCTGFLGIYYYVVKNCNLPKLNHLRNHKRRASIDFELIPKMAEAHARPQRQLSDKEVDEIMTAPQSFTGERLQSIDETSTATPDDVLSLDDIKFEMPKLSEVLSKKISAPKLREYQVNEHDAGMENIDRNISRFQAFLRSLLMHCAVGTTFGGIMTMVGEPQNLIVAERMEWSFGTFMLKMLPVSGTVLPCGILTCVLLEKSRHFGYGTRMPEDVRLILEDFEQSEYGKMTGRVKAMLVMQLIGAVLLCVGLVTHVAEVGFIGLMVVIFLTTFNGVTEEHEIAHAFLESMPFVSLLVVFFGIVGMIHDTHLFKPIIEMVLELQESLQTIVLFLVNGALSMVSDNVFVATIFVDEIHDSFRSGMPGEPHHAANGASVDPAHHHRLLAEDSMSRELYEKLGISIVAGTNLPSMATPNGQASLLFILTSNIAPLVHLSYRKMCLMTLPYTVVATTVGLVAITFLL